jgi:hypothetical protein
MLAICSVARKVSSKAKLIDYWWRRINRRKGDSCHRIDTYQISIISLTLREQSSILIMPTLEHSALISHLFPSQVVYVMSLLIIPQRMHLSEMCQL